MLIYAIALIAMMMLNASPRFTAMKRKVSEAANQLRDRFKR